MVAHHGARADGEGPVGPAEEDASVGPGDGKGVDQEPQLATRRDDARDVNPLVELDGTISPASSVPVCPWPDPSGTEEPSTPWKS